MEARPALRVLVTGGAGHLGRHVTEALVAAGHHVHAVDRAPLPGLARAPAEATVADLATWDGLAEALAGADALVDLAAIPNLDTLPEPEVYRANVALAARVAFAAMAAGVRRHVYASSQTVLGQALAPRIVSPDTVPLDEDHPVRPREGYGLSKLAGEGLARLVAERLGIGAVAIRLPVVWAAETFARHVEKRANDPVQAAKSLWAYVDARDAAEAFRLAVEAPLEGFHVVQVGAARPFADEDIRGLLTRWHPSARILGPIGPDTPVWSIDRARRLLGYRPRFVWRPRGIETAEPYHRSVPA